MKILQVTSSFYPVVGGMEKVVYEVSKVLVEKGHDVSILTSDFLCEKQTKHKEIIDGIKVIRFKNKYYLGGYGYCSDAMQWLKKNYKNYDVVHCHGYNRYLSEFAVRCLYNKIFTIFTPHGFIHTRKNILAKKIHDFTIGRFIKKANICTALTKLDYQDYARLGVDKNKIVEIPNGIEINKYKNIKTSDVKLFKKKYALDKNILLCVGRIHKSKGIQYVMEAIKNIDCKLLVVGPDAGYKYCLEKITRKNKLENKVVFTGCVSDKELITAYSASDLLVVFSEWEGFGITVIESMASGTPVIASNRGSLPFLINNEKNGFIIKFKDVIGLEKKIKEVFSNKTKTKQIIKMGIKKSKNYDWGQIVDFYLKEYEK